MEGMSYLMTQQQCNKCSDEFMSTYEGKNAFCKGCLKEKPTSTDGEEYLTTDLNFTGGRFKMVVN